LKATQPRAYQEQERRDARYKLLRWAQVRGALDGASSASCMTERVFNASTRPGVSLDVYPDGRTCAHWYGVGRCKNPTSCPWCAPRQSSERAKEIAKLIKAHWGGAETAPKGGPSVWLVTLTLPHGPQDTLNGLRAQLAKAWQRFTDKRALARWLTDGHSPDDLSASPRAVPASVPASVWMEPTTGAPRIVGWCRASEATRSPSSGWHPHYHCLIFWDGEHAGARHLAGHAERGSQSMSARLDDLYKRAEKTWSAGDRDTSLELVGSISEGGAAADQVDAIRQGWARAVKASAPHGDARAVNLASLDVSFVSSLRGLAGYLAKIGFEVAGGPGGLAGGKEAKGSSLTPFQLLQLARDKDGTPEGREALELWREWVDEMSGAHLVTWSRGALDVRQRYADAPEVEFSLDPSKEATRKIDLGSCPVWLYLALVRLGDVEGPKGEAPAPLVLLHHAETGRALYVAQGLQAAEGLGFLEAATKYAEDNGLAEDQYHEAKERVAEIRARKLLAWLDRQPVAPLPSEGDLWT